MNTKFLYGNKKTFYLKNFVNLLTTNIDIYYHLIIILKMKSEGDIILNTNILKGVRVGFGYNQLDMANMIGISRKMYNYKENGKRDFTLSEIKKIAKHLNLTKEAVDQIFFNN